MEPWKEERDKYEAEVAKTSKPDLRGFVEDVVVSLNQANKLYVRFCGTVCNHSTAQTNTKIEVVIKSKAGDILMGGVYSQSARRWPRFWRLQFSSTRLISRQFRYGRGIAQKFSASAFFDTAIPIAAIAFSAQDGFQQRHPLDLHGLIEFSSGVEHLMTCLSNLLELSVPRWFFGLGPFSSAALGALVEFVHPASPCHPRVRVKRLPAMEPSMSLMASLQEAPEILKAIRMHVAVNVGFSMVDDFMRVLGIEIVVGMQSVRMDLCCRVQRSR